MKKKTVAVGGKYERQLQRLGIFERLLHAVTQAAVVVLRLDNRKRNVWLVVKNTTKGTSAKFRYAPANKELGSLVDQLAIAYSKQRVPILILILAEHPDRIRGFAEAFRLIGNH